jgi:hypothetical protein
MRDNERRCRDCGESRIGGGELASAKLGLTLAMTLRSARTATSAQMQFLTALRDQRYGASQRSDSAGRAEALCGTAAQPLGMTRAVDVGLEPFSVLDDEVAAASTEPRSDAR